MRTQTGPRNSIEIVPDRGVDLVEVVRFADGSALPGGDPVDLGQIVRGRLPETGAHVGGDLLGRRRAGDDGRDRRLRREAADRHVQQVDDRAGGERLQLPR